MSIEKTGFGCAKDGTPVDLYTITNSNGVTAKFTNFGAILVSLLVPDREGNMADVVLGYEDVTGYYVNEPNFGATIGRHANRIGGAKFSLNGKEYTLDANDGDNNLHGGYDGYHKRVWEANAYQGEQGQVMEFTYHSKDMDQGFPGNLDVTVTYTLTEDNSIVIHYKALSDKDTICNLTNHSYFNLAGHDHGTILDQKVWLDSDSFTWADKESIPDGKILPVEGTPMDFRRAKLIGQDIEADYDQLIWGKGFDHNWVLKTTPGEVSLVGSMEDEASGRVMEFYTDLPGIQFYCGNFLDDEKGGKGGAIYKHRSGACFETQFYPNAIHCPEFAQPVIKAGEEFETTTIYKFTVK